MAVSLPSASRRLDAAIHANVPAQKAVTKERGSILVTTRTASRAASAAQAPRRIAYPRRPIAETAGLSFARVCSVASISRKAAVIDVATNEYARGGLSRTTASAGFSSSASPADVAASVIKSEAMAEVRVPTYAVSTALFCVQVAWGSDGKSWGGLSGWLSIQLNS